MKKVLFLILIMSLLGDIIYSQTLSVFDIDDSEYPIIKASFFALDSNYNQIRDLSTKDFKILENSEEKNISNVYCSSLKAPKAISAVLTIDLSSSMAGQNISNAKSAILAWINTIPLGKSECAITGFTLTNLYIQDFTTNRSKLQKSIKNISVGGGTNYDAAFLSPMAGALLVAKDASYKKIIVLITDGCVTGNETKIIEEANQIGATIYIVSLNNQCPNILKNIAEQTGGQWFENITTHNEAEGLYLRILQMAQESDYCEIEWETEPICENNPIYAVISCFPINSNYKLTYVLSSENIAKLDIQPNNVRLEEIIPGIKKDTVVSVTAMNASFNCTNIIVSNPNFDIHPKSFYLLPGTQQNLTVSFTPMYNTYSFCEFKFESIPCTNNLYVVGGATKIISDTNTLILTHPNGGEKFIVGSDTMITWKGIFPNDTVSLDYSYNNGRSWTVIIDSTWGSEYKWHQIPNTISDSCLLRVIKNKSAQPLIHIFSNNKLPVTAISWSPDGTVIASAGEDGEIFIRNLDTGENIHILKKHHELVTDLQWDYTGTKLASASYDSTIIIWDTKKGILLDMLVGHTDHVYSISWSPDGTRIVSGGLDGSIKIWDILNGKELISVTGNSFSVNSIKWSNDGNKIASGHGNRTIKIWNAVTADLIQTMSGNVDFINSVCWSNDDTHIASACNDGTIKIWNVVSGNEIVSKLGHKRHAYSVNWHPQDSKIVSAGYDNIIKIWDTNNGNLLQSIEGHSNWINHVKWNSVGTKIASASADWKVKIWSIQEEADTCDALFSIVIPLITSDKIDMKKCIYGCVKDSIITNFIVNNSSYRCRIDSIWFTGTDADAFTIISGLPQYIIEQKQRYFIEINFKPKRIGHHNAKVNIKTQAQTLQYEIEGEGVGINLQVFSDLIDFGKVLVGNKKDTILVVLENTGVEDITITSSENIGPDNTQFTILNGGGSFTIESGGSRKLNIEFKPLSNGKTSGQIAFNYNQIGSPVKVVLYGEGISPELYVVKQIDIPDLFCDSNKDTTLIIYSRGNSNLEVSDFKITGENKDEFKILNLQYSYSIVPTDSLVLQIQYKSNKRGKKSAEISFMCNTLNIQTEEIKIPISVNNANIDLKLSKFEIVFRDINLNQTASRSVKIINHSSIPFRWNSPVKIGKFEITINPIITPINDSSIVKVDFLGGRLKNEDFNELYDFLDSCDNHLLLHLKAYVLPDASAQITIPNINAKIGEIVEIPIYLEQSNNVNKTNLEKIQCEISYNTTLLTPKDSTRFDITNGMSYLHLLLPYQPNQDTLANIAFRVGLGNAKETDIKIESYEFIGGSIYSSKQDGKLTITNLCEEGGTRLLNPNQTIFLNIKEQSQDNIKITYKLTEKGNTSIKIFDALGNEIKVVLNENITRTGEFNKNIYISSLPNGVYFIVLQTPTVTLSSKFIKIKHF